MLKKSFILSSLGLTNIIFDTFNYNDFFTFKLGNKEIEIRQIFAEFISPYVSHIHKSDPTINYIDINEFCRTDFSTDILSKIIELSQGNKIEIDEKESEELRIISVILGNEEIINEINKLYPIDFDKENIDSMIKYLNYFEKCQNSIINTIEFSKENKQSLIDVISSHFQTNETKFLNLSKSTIYSIISNEHFKAKNADSLFEFINQIFEEDEDENCYYTKMNFYEFVDINSLNETNKKEFIDNIEYDLINHGIWNKLKEFFISQINLKPINQSNSNITNIEYTNNPNNEFNGIVSYLLAKGITINVTASSSVFGGSEKNVIDFSNKNESYNSSSQPNTWVLYDFKERKVKPSHYTIMSDHWIDSLPGRFRPQSWVIEGSNDKQNWTKLDVHLNDKSLDSQSVIKTFSIQNNNNNEYFQYLRIRQIDINTGGDHILRFSSLEYFGSIIEK